jgi:hypothetical protein
MSARHANGRDSICCASVGCSSIRTRLRSNDLTNGAELALRGRAAQSSPALGDAASFCGPVFFRSAAFCCNAAVWHDPAFLRRPETFCIVDRALDCVDVSASDQRFNQPLGSRPIARSAFMSSSIATSCSKMSIQKMSVRTALVRTALVRTSSSRAVFSRTVSVRTMSSLTASTSHRPQLLS